MPDLSTLPLSDLIACCQENTRHFLRTREATDDRYCLELFRRAVQKGDEGAWAFIYTFYSTDQFLGDHYLLKWVRSWLHGRHGPAIRGAFTEEEFVQEVWLRFMHSEAARSFSFASMGHLMAYLRRLVNNFALDVARKRVPHLMEAETDYEAAGLEQVISRVPDTHPGLEAQTAWRESMESLVKAVCSDIVATEHEWLVFRDHFLEGLPPREVYRLHPQTFSANEVEVTRTRLARRLRKFPYLLNRYITLVVLGDDERLTIVFRDCILNGEADQYVLQRYASLFQSDSELTAVKAQVLEAARCRPELIHLLSI